MPILSVETALLLMPHKARRGKDRVDTTLQIVKEIFQVQIIHTVTPITLTVFGRSLQHRATTSICILHTSMCTGTYTGTGTTGIAAPVHMTTWKYST